MIDKGVPGTGERAALGGYLPQFDAFANLAYKELVNGNLEWIKIADHEAGKLDDIQYCTSSEIHAYQVKWTTIDETISYLDFKDLLINACRGWKLIKAHPDAVGKRVYAHILTNKRLSQHDTIADNKKKVGSFHSFFNEVWLNLKGQLPVDSKWKFSINELKTICELEQNEFDQFIKFIIFQPEYINPTRTIERSSYSQIDQDIIDFSRYIIERVADPERTVKVLRHQIVRDLNWGNRFKTTFSHELIVDSVTYQPIQSTIDLLDAKLGLYDSGYIFLVGGPGTGKSTLLTEWSKSTADQIIKYYAFDFTNPNIKEEERGESTNMLFDLVFQIKEKTRYVRNVLPDRDSVYLRKCFYDQIKYLGEEFKSNGRRTIIIIDGLDHIRREYKIEKSFISELPSPEELPEGVFIVLGSQTYQFQEMPVSVQLEFEKQTRTVEISPLLKAEVFLFLEKSLDSISLNLEQKEELYEISQGHPLYLTYMRERISKSDDINAAIRTFESIDGSIENYYSKLWKPIEPNGDLITLLGYLSRINGYINPKFIEEWNFAPQVFIEFVKYAKPLLNTSSTSWVFFHNSFRQFLLVNTSRSLLTGEYSSEVNKQYHSRLAEFYKRSSYAAHWRANFHIYHAGKYSDFLHQVTPDLLRDNLINFRPASDIISDIRLGIQIAKETGDLVVLARYMFSMAEIEQRSNLFDVASLTGELLKLGKFDSARDHLRSGSTLFCSKFYGLDASLKFYDAGYHEEAAILFNLSIPDCVLNDKIDLNLAGRDSELKRELERWALASAYYLPLEKILQITANIIPSESSRYDMLPGEGDLHLRNLILASYANGLIELKKWNELDTIVETFDTSEQDSRKQLFYVFESVIDSCLYENNIAKANEYLHQAIKVFEPSKTSDFVKINVANWIWKISGNAIEAYKWIQDVKQPSNLNRDYIGYDSDLNLFLPLIYYNRILNFSGNGVPITMAIPNYTGSERGKSTLVQFERMLCLLVQIVCDPATKFETPDQVIGRLKPIIDFYNQKLPPVNSYWYKIENIKGEFFNFLITSICKTKENFISALASYLLLEFDRNVKYWKPSDQRSVLMSLLENGCDYEILKDRVREIEDSMLLERDGDGRVTECLLQTKFHFFLNDFVSAENCIKQAIKESFGVGYRKDYQVDSWIKWIEKVNELDPSQAVSRLHLVLGNLEYIKGSVEGRAYWSSSEMILDAAFKVNIDYGVKQFKWQFENNLCDLNDAIDSLLTHTLGLAKTESEFEIIKDIYIDLLLLLYGGSTIRLLSLLLDKGKSICISSFKELHFFDVLRGIEKYALEENQFSLISTVTEFARCNDIDISILYPDFEMPVASEDESERSNSSSNSLRIGETSLSETDVMTKAVDFETLIGLIEAESAHSYFDWTKVLESFKGKLNHKELAELLKHERVGSKSTEFYSTLSHLAIAVGELDFAQKFALKAINKSSESGWLRYMDGGTRINAIKAFNLAFPNERNRRGFDLFCEDIVNGNYNTHYIESIDEIFPILKDDFDPLVVWDEVQKYIRALFSNSNPSENLPMSIDRQEDLEILIVEFLITLSESPTNILRDAVLKLIAKQICRNNASADQYLRSLAAGDVRALNDFSDLAMFVLSIEEGMLKKFKKEIQRHAVNSDFFIRMKCRTILTKLKITIPRAPKIDLPLVYNLVLQKHPTLRDEIEFDDEGNPIVDLSNPLEMIRPFELYFDILSRRTGLKQYNLVYRAFNIMKSDFSESNFTIDFENSIRWHLDQVNVKYGYPRPRVIAAKHALGRVICELVDSECLSSVEASEIFYSFDFPLLNMKINKRPIFVNKMRSEDFKYWNDEWVSSVIISNRLDRGLSSDLISRTVVVGEVFELVALENGAPCEKCVWALSRKEKMAKDGSDIFSFAHNAKAERYYSLTEYADVIIQKSQRINSLDLKFDWIAINPSLALFLGWVKDEGRIFGWKSSAGEFMAESVYWTSGNPKMSKNHHNNEVGHGWYVQVSQEGYDQILRATPSVSFKMYMQRHVWRENRLIESSTTKRVKLQQN